MKGKLHRDPIASLADNNIRRQEVIRNLGVQLNESMNFHAHIEYAAGKATRIMHKILSIARRHYRIPLPAIRMYMNAAMASITGYDASL